MKTKAKQYTIRNVAPSIDTALRKKAAERRESLNSIVLEALAKEAGLTSEPQVYHELDDLIGSWVKDPETEKALEEQRKINSGDWE